MGEASRIFSITEYTFRYFYDSKKRDEKLVVTVKSSQMCMHLSDRQAVYSPDVARVGRRVNIGALVGNDQACSPDIHPL